MVFKSFKVKNVGFKFRRPRWDDWRGYMESRRELYEESLHNPLWMPTENLGEAEAIDKFATALKAVELGRKIFIVVEREKAFAGMGWVDINSGMFGDGYGVLGIELLKRCRGIGIGSRLMLCLEEEAKKRKVRNLTLKVVECNPAFNLYSKAGYKEIGRKPNYVKSKAREEAFEERPAIIEMLKIIG